MEKKEAIKILKDFHDESALFSIRNALETLYPEFKESRDEKIRKRLIEFFKDWGKTRSHCWSIYIPDILAWLEKQGKQEPINPELKESEDEKVRKEIVEYLKKNLRLEWATWLEKQGEVESDNDDIEVEEKGIREAFNKIEDEKQCKQKPQRMISAEAKEAMYNKPADTVEQKCEESKTKVFDAPTPFEDKLYAFVAACEFLTLPAKIEFIKEHSQELLDAAKEQIGKEQSSTWSKEDEKILNGLISSLVRIEANTRTDSTSINYTFPREIDWLKSLKQKIGE